MNKKDSPYRYWKLIPLFLYFSILFNWSPLPVLSKNISHPHSKIPNNITQSPLVVLPRLTSESFKSAVFVPPPTPKVILPPPTYNIPNIPPYASNNSILQIGQSVALSFGWSGQEWIDLEAIVESESGWNPNSINSSSGACGLGQQEPCSGLNTLSVQNQMIWICNYIKSRYQDPINAWNFHQANGWY